MDKEILKQLYKPVFIHEYSDEYFDALIDVIETSCNNQSYEWFIKCIKCFVLEDFEDEFRLSLANDLHTLNKDISLEMICKNEAELIVFTQAIVYECVINCSDQVRASIISLALNTIMFGIEKSLNQFYVTQMKSFYREYCKKFIQDIRKSVNEENNKDSFDFNNTENKVLKWMLNVDREMFSELNNEQFIMNFGKEMAKKTGVNPIFNYPEAYIAKILNSSSIVKNIYSEEIEIKKVFGKLDFNEEYAKCDNVLFPIMSMTFKNNVKISLIDFAIEVYYEQILFNNIILNNYGE